MELRQRRVATYEVKSKMALAIVALYLFYQSSIEIYFFIYFIWSLVVAVYWIAVLSKEHHVHISLRSRNYFLVSSVLRGFSLWTHFSGLATFFIYNSTVFFLGLLSFSSEDVAFFTVVNKVSNLFFVIPMFLQSVVPIVLSNANLAAREQFNKILLLSFFISLTQVVIFALFGRYIGIFFGLDVDATLSFYEYGLIISVGIFLLNTTRPLSTFLFIKSQPRRIMLRVFVPAVALAMVVYPWSLNNFGLIGISYAILFVYSFLAVLLLSNYLYLKRVEL
jgi:O-antigen/teichoic acid export membrane protein